MSFTAPASGEHTVKVVYAGDAAHRALHLLAHEHIGGEVKPCLGCEPRQCEHEQRDGEHDPETVAAGTAGRRRRT